MKRATLITGPVASGKSTLAHALKTGLEKCGQRCIHIEVDARNLLDFCMAAHKAKVCDLAQELVASNIEIILVAVNPEMGEIRTLCCELGFTLVRHLTTEIFHGWPGYKLGVSRVSTEREEVHDEMEQLAQKLECEFEQYALQLHEALARRARDEAERFRKATEERIRELRR